MAQAKIHRKDYELTLTLTRAEAETLYFITRCIGGDITGSPRRLTDSVLNAFRAAGVAEVGYPVEFLETAIYFCDGEPI